MTTARARDGTDIAEILAKIGTTPCTFRRDCCGHADFEHQIRFAEVEAAIGVHAIYFPLHDMPYFRSPKFQDQLQRLRDLGHSIGCHYSTLGAWLRERIAPADTLARALDVLREGGDVTLAAAHGSEITYQQQAYEYEVFDHFDPARNVGGRVASWGVPRVNAASLGLAEVYIDGEHTRYLSDSAGIWRGWRGDHRPREFERLPRNINVGLAALDDLGPQDRVQWLAHPVWWQINA